MHNRVLKIDDTESSTTRCEYIRIRKGFQNLINLQTVLFAETMRFLLYKMDLSNTCHVLECFLVAQETWQCLVLRCVEHDQAAENTLGITNYSCFLKEILWFEGALTSCRVVNS